MDRKQQLSQLIVSAQDTYYNETPFLTDAEYDLLCEELFALDPNHPALKNVGAPAPRNSVFPKVTHDRPMGSLLKVSSTEDLLKWAGSYVASGEVCWSEKLDGFSLSLPYKRGKLVLAATRGDGVQGENIIANALMMKALPTEISHPGTIYVKAEVICHKSDFALFQLYLGTKGKTAKNPRNSMAGAARSLDGDGCTFGTIMAHDVVGEGVPDTEHGKFIFLEKLGFKVAPYGQCSTAEITKVLDLYAKKRDQLDYEIDGLVIRENNVALSEGLGEVDGRPRAHRAFKFPSLAVETTLSGVTWQVGRTGALTPVAEVEPVDVGGVTISRVMLNNIEFVDALGLTLGCGVKVLRSNDVIPYLAAKTSEGTTKIEHPAVCPSCGGTTVLESPVVYCVNSQCPDQISYRLSHFLKVLGIKGWGDATLDKLVAEKVILTAYDLYELDPPNLEQHYGISAKISSKVLSELVKKSREVPVPTFVKCLGIQGFSESFAEKAMEKYPTFAELRAATVDGLCEVKGIGPSVAEAAVAGFKANAALIDALLTVVTLKEGAKQVVSGGLSGKSFCFTGYRDGAAESAILAQGGKIASGVSKNTTYLVCATENAQTVKAQKARELGVKVIGPNELATILKAD